ncbi:MAG: LuxR C-terminal-related transcriptional regulator [Myxococcaceae bacterium]
MDLGLVSALELRTVLVSGDPLARGGLAQLLTSQPGISLTAQTGAEDDLSELRDGTDVLVWDTGVEPRHGIDRMKEWTGLQIPTVALLPDERSASDAHAAGARGLLLRTVEGARLAAAVRAVSLGLVVLDDAFSAALPGVRALAPAAGSETLTPREMQVLHKLAGGMSNKEIASALDISEHTAKFHVNAVMQKLGVQNRTEAVVRAVRSGLLTL